MKQSQKSILVWMMLILLLVTIWHLWSSPRKNQDSIPFSEFISRVEAGQVNEVTIKGVEV